MSQQMHSGRMAGVPAVDSRRGGFTLVELLIVAAIVGILAGLAIPNLRTVILRARAAEVVADLDVVKTATLQFQADRHVWPDETAVGSIPSGLDEFLPDQYSFQREGYQLDYENWALPSGLPTDPTATTLIGVSAAVEDPILGNALVELLGSAIVFSVSNAHTIVIDRS